MRLKHNKKRNTAFVYEALVRELTKSAIKNDKNKMKKLKKIIKEHFSKNSSLKRELKVFKPLYETHGVDKHFAEKMIIEAKIAHSKINKKEVFKEQSSLIRTINKTLGTSVFTNFVPNYKNLASIYSMFGDSIGIKDKVLLEGKIVESLTRDPERKETKDPIDNLVYKSFVKRFNERYQNKLNEGQKILLTKYVTSFVDGGLELKVIMNEEIGNLKEKLRSMGGYAALSSDKKVETKAGKVLDLLEGYKDKEIDLVMIEEVLKIQSLVEELEKDDT